MMGRYWAIIGTVILTSCYYFPFETVLLPSVNTKLIMAVVSLVILITDLAKGQRGAISKYFIVLCFFASLVSLTSLFAIYYNNTQDYLYVTYIISMLVWMGGAYTLGTVIKWLHNKVTIPIIVYYLVAACAMQCILALAINRYLAVESFCNSFCEGLSSVKKYMDNSRLYGVGCSFDTAGLRFAAVLVMMGYFLPRIVAKYKEKNRIIISYAFAFVLISIVGNMISRTTSVGMIMALVYVLCSLKLHILRIDSETGYLWKWILLLFTVSLALIILLYNLDDNFKENFRFGFEGFFSLFEKGKWEVHSNEILITMYRFPEIFKTWVIGDGYIFNTNLDPYYTGVEYKEYYMATDVGYLRFIYYSGLIGLGAFVIFMCKAASICMRRFRNYRDLFLLLLILQFTIWLKVSTDIFCVFALFLVINDVPEIDTESEDIVA